MTRKRIYVTIWCHQCGASWLMLKDMGRAPQPFEYICPHCGREDEMWTLEPREAEQ